MNDLEVSLQKGRNGTAILFCGAGFTADCLNFQDGASLGVTSHLLGILNDELSKGGKKSGYKDIKNASKCFQRDIGSYDLMRLLKDRFILRNVSGSIVDIINYPWSNIYTTNYDNGIELALQSAGKSYLSLSNLDDPKKLLSNQDSTTPIVHLHGYAPAWDENNFGDSCILDAVSYHNLPGVKKWLDQLRHDVERADIVIFIGFSVNDFHISNVLFNASVIKGKSFFINHPNPNPDIDEKEAQSEFGIPLYIGRECFGNIISNVLIGPEPEEPSLASFQRYEVVKPSDAVPSVLDIENLFIWGTVVHEHLKRDLIEAKSDYHVLRNEVNEVCRNLEDNGKAILIYGDICEGKTLTILDIMNSVAVNRPVFLLGHTYVNILDEVSSILSFYSRALLVVENCFSIQEERLLGVVRQVAASDGGVLLSARTVSTEGETGKLKKLRMMESFKELEIGRLSVNEIEALVVLIAQIAGWRDEAGLSAPQLRKFIEKDCRGSIPNVLLRIMNSRYVQSRYREEYEKTNHVNAQDRRMVISALLVANIGLETPLSFISNLFEEDFYSVLSRISKQVSALRLVSIEGNYIRTIPSIGARNILKHVVEDREVVNTTIFILEKLADSMRRSDFENHVFSQLMRYSILSSAVENNGEINRFFDHISKIAYFRAMPLFWLQWHMAMCAQERWLDAEKYLDMGYTAATAFERVRVENFNRKQLDDRRAKFLIARAIASNRSNVELFRDVKESLEICSRLLQDPELTHHVYETIFQVWEFLSANDREIIEVQRDLLIIQFNNLRNRAELKIASLASINQKYLAEDIIRKTRSIVQ